MSRCLYLRFSNEASQRSFKTHRIKMVFPSAGNLTSISTNKQTNKRNILKMEIILAIINWMLMLLLLRLLWLARLEV